MSDDPSHYALPLFSLIDRGKVDPRQAFPDELAEHLRAWLEGSFGIRALSSKILLAGNEPYLILHEVQEDALTALFSLVDVQGTQLFRYERSDEQTIRLTPLRIKVD
jgi:hypothetical protein